MGTVSIFGDEDIAPWRETLRRVLPFVLGIPLVVALGALLYLASNAANDREKALDRQRDSFEIIALTRLIDGSMAKAETSLARYVISLQPDTGRLFQSQWRSAAAQIDALTFATRSDPQQRERVKELKAAFATRGKTLNEIGLRTTYDQRMGALAQFHAAGTAPSLDEINRLLRDIISAEDARLKERSLAVTATSHRNDRLADTYRLVGLVLLVGGLFFAWVAVAAVSDRRYARKLADSEAQRAWGLEAAVAQRTAELREANAQLHKEAIERAAAEDSLRQMQKMEAVGQLTGGIAHDFNNMLAVVVGGLELARRKIVEEPAEAHRHIDNAMEGANRASALTRRLLAFARSEPLLPSALDADRLITGMVDLIDRTIGDQIRVVMRQDAGGWAVFVDRHQMENAILNLCVNARDAMDGRGTLTLATGQAVLTQGEIGECPAGEYVVLSVEDTGCGMTAEVLSRVFEPFFTTKPVGKGTGLGLSQIFGFVRQCAGEIRIESQPGHGTQVQLFLPRRIVTGEGSEPLTLAAMSEAESTDQPPRRILVVEDDPRVLAQTIDALAELGHLPLACAESARAAEMLADNPDVSLLISDVLMPEMTGPEMVKQLPEQFHHIPVLFVTGYAGDVQNSEMFRDHPVLRKPFTLGGLAAAISQAINESHHSETAAAAE
jgi:signal transduction histidine kinase/ActR/RegA family two-component response regulator